MQELQGLFVSPGFRKIVSVFYETEFRKSILILILCLRAESRVAFRTYFVIMTLGEFGKRGLPKDD